MRPVPGNHCQFDVTETNSDMGLRFETDSQELAGKWMESFRCSMYCPYSPGNMRKFGTTKVKSTKKLNERL